MLDQLFDTPCHLFDAHAQAMPTTADRRPGSLVARRDDALLRRTIVDAVWIGHVRRADQADAFKLPASQAFQTQAAGLPHWDVALDSPADEGWRGIRLACEGDVATLRFPFYNGAMGTGQCERLNAALRLAPSWTPRHLATHR